MEHTFSRTSPAKMSFSSLNLTLAESLIFCSKVSKDSHLSLYFSSSASSLPILEELRSIPDWTDDSSLSIPELLDSHFCSHFCSKDWKPC